MIELARNVDWANQIVNHPDVIEDAGIDEAVDLVSFVSSNGGFVVTGEHGCFVVRRLDIGIYEIHTFVLPAGRGIWAKDFVQAGASWIFTNTDAVDLVTPIAQGHLAAKALAISAGMRQEFIRYPGIKFRGRVVPCQVYGMQIQGWASHAQGFNQVGEMFHHRLREQAGDLGIEYEPHADDDPDHDKYVGIAFTMICCGQIGKGVAFYNRWARLCHHHTASVVTLKPPAIRVDVGILTFEGERMRLHREI